MTVSLVENAMDRSSLETSTILSWHREPDGRLLCYVECSYCEVVEEFITVEAAAAFGTIHRRSPLHVQNFLKALRVTRNQAGSE